MESATSIRLIIPARVARTVTSAQRRAASTCGTIGAKTTTMNAFQSIAYACSVGAAITSRQNAASKLLEVKWIPGSENEADMFTKNLSRPDIDRHGEKFSTDEDFG